MFKKESIITAKKLIIEEFGSYNILINGAGGNHPKGTTTKETLEIINPILFIEQQHNLTNSSIDPTLFLSHSKMARIFYPSP